MRKTLLMISAFLFVTLTAVCQTAEKFSPVALHQDLAYLKQQLFDVHADPFTEISRKDYAKLFEKADQSIKEPMTALEFYQLIRPMVANLSDEHAQINLPKELYTYNDRSVFLPFTLKKSGAGFVIDTVLSVSSGLKANDAITAINGIKVKELVARAAEYTTGYPDQRQRNALKQFGYLYSISGKLKEEFRVESAGRSITVTGIRYMSWENYLKSIFGGTVSCDQLLSYRKISETGYINACSFGARGKAAFTAYERAADSLFLLAKKDGVKRIVIDVSRNTGGNSALGDFLIRQFYKGEYLSYRMSWRRSNEYLDLIKSWGIKNEDYEKLNPGEVMHSGPDTPWMQGVKDPFKGKVYIMIGSGTFSSAIIFATIIKDSKLAQLIGEEPLEGHPTHFGEMYGTALPNTKLAVSFGVKEWIRPLGKDAGNRLTPDIFIPLDRAIEDVIRDLEKSHP
ncbi:S41 family peptidase [Terrimonas sp. NA20]|uniref:S41 family peptidase n=1 Tax=Terrimonas ginsenosidimutans TaxID=2908004 RepID=A0ABS9KYY4_9BACT|nr:S41 family peptidase [Terrimonas ginsenosidimutans]MCG2617556.1 S41 family peptidase [Terrimonas ginsenosidimutans]